MEQGPGAAPLLQEDSSAEIPRRRRIALRSEWPAVLRKRRMAWSIAFLIISFVLVNGSQSMVFQGTLIVIYAIVALSQEWLFGRAGQISLGAAALMAIGAYTTALTSDRPGCPFPVPMLLSLLAGALIGAIISVPGLRFRGLYLMLTTLALQFVVRFTGLQIETGAHQSGYLVVVPDWLADPKRMLLFCLAILAVVMISLDGMYRSAPGRVWNAIRQNEVAAAVIGVSTVRWKIFAFVGSSAICALGGSLYAFYLSNVDYNTFSLDLALTIVVIVFVGGVGRLFGAIIGAVFIGLLPAVLDDVSGWLPLGATQTAWLNVNESLLASAIYGLLLLLVLLFERSGIAGLLERLLRWSSRWVLRWNTKQ